MGKHAKVTEMQFFPEQNSLELSVPKGLKFDEFSGSTEKLLSEELLKKLRVACPGCFSGISVLIRERHEEIINVDLETMETLPTRLAGGGFADR
jgi:hypothetical protein